MAGLLSSLLLGCTRYYQGPASDHFDGTRFFNPASPMNKGLGEVLKWRLTGNRQHWPQYQGLKVYDRPPQRVAGPDLRVSFVGQATMLIQMQGLNILTDPFWSDRASPFSWIGPRRVHPPGIRLADLPPIDVILVSHNHYDHMDLETIGNLWQRDQPRIIVPLGNDTIIKSHDQSVQAEAYDWGDRVELSAQLSLHLLPMHHWSARGIFDRNKALWAAFGLTGPDCNVYFAGDTGYGDGSHFRAAREAFGTFRLAILPIGAYKPRWFMAYGHMNPDESLQALADLGSPVMVAIHFGTIQLADNGYDQPLKDLERAMRIRGVLQSRVHVLMPGQHNLFVSERKKHK